MIDNSWTTMHKLQNLLQTTRLTATQFTAIINEFGIDMVPSTMSRALKAGKFTSHEVDQMLRPIVLKIEDLVERAAPFEISFESAETTKIILDLIDLGVDLGTGAGVTNGSLEIAVENQGATK